MMQQTEPTPMAGKPATYANPETSPDGESTPEPQQTDGESAAVAPSPDGTEPAAQSGTQTTQEDCGTPDAPPAANEGGLPPPDDPAFAQTLLRAVDERVRRAEKSVLRSIAAQSGMAEDALMQMLAKARAADAQGGEAEQLREREALLGKRLIVAELRRVGAEMGLVDAEAALALLPPAALRVDEAGEVAGVQDALAALRAEKGYLFGRAGGAWAERLGGGLAPLTGVEEAFYRKNPALRK